MLFYFQLNLGMKGVRFCSKYLFNNCYKENEFVKTRMV